ncbi:MAG: DNA-binding response regulator [Cytophagales bacterium]|nr:MAG: DNA-binding response regulator [Cytophagales bacterium]TAF61485.1 MAG: DNA-binding response regulator [Cytophagales bacterium]
MEANTYRILIVDDEPDILELLKYNLEKEGYLVKTAEDGVEAIEQARKFLPHLVLMDIMMPRLDGVEACRQMRVIPELNDTYIIFLTARAEEYSEVAAFEVGADDYITKPVKPRALLSRLNALFRRDHKKDLQETPNTQNVIKIADFVINRSSYTFSQNGQVIALPKKEFELIYFLAQNPNKVFSREDILVNIWGTDVYVLARTVDVHIRRIREKIGEGFIKTVKGVGYKFEL